MIWAKHRRLLLLLVYVLFFLHTALWHYWGYTGVGHLGFGEFFGTLRSGVVTAGTVFSLIVFFHAIFFGGLFCGWFCHWGITQDVAAWIMKKCGIKPVMAQLNSRLIPWFWFLIILAQVVLYWFYSGFPTSFSFNPSATPVWSGVPRSILLICITTIVSGFLLIFLFGERAFCRSICTFRLWFSWFEKFAPHKVRQIKECTSCQLECTNVCPMGLDVAGEIRDLGHVKNTECVKCHICIGACPNGALQTSFKKNEFHKDGPAIVQPATFTDSTSLVQVCMAAVVLILFGFNIGGNMSLSLGFLIGYLMVKIYATMKISVFEVVIAATLLVGYYYKIDMNDSSSLLKGLTVIAIFLAAARFFGYESGLNFINNDARKTAAPALLMIAALLSAGVLAYNETRLSLLIHKANAALSQKDLQTYASIMDGCAAGHSDPAGTYYDLGRVQLQLNQPDKALESFKQSINLIYKFEAAEAMLNLLFDTGATDQWADLAEFLSIKQPEVARFQVLKANALMHKNNFDASEKLLNELQQKHPNNHEVFIALGELRLSQTRIFEARDFYEKAYQIAPASSAFFLADAYMHLNMLPEAEKFFTEAVNGQPRNVIYLLSQGNALASQQKLREAISSWQKILELDPDFEAAKENIARAQQALDARKAAILGHSKPSPEENIETTVDQQ